jgi:acylphosphatase
VSERGRLDAVVRGQVQGVGYRWFVVREASRLALDGWVANQADGSVQVVAEGTVDALEGLLAALWEGPSGALVTEVHTRREPARGGLVSFEIRSGGHPGD